MRRDLCNYFFELPICVVYSNSGGDMWEWNVVQLRHVPFDFLQINQTNRAIVVIESKEAIDFCESNQTNRFKIIGEFTNITILKS